MDISPNIFAYNFPLTLSHPLIIHTRTAISHLYPPATSYLYRLQVHLYNPPLSLCPTISISHKMIWILSHKTSSIRILIFPKWLSICLRFQQCPVKSNVFLAARD